jgi:hypothetical protein
MALNGDVRELVQVQGLIMLEPATAEAYLRMKAAARLEDVIVEIPTPAGGYRSLYMQRDMHQRPWAYNLDPESSVRLAPPGYSTHGLGDRVDIIVGEARAWAIANARRFGFVREFGANDPGHFRFVGIEPATQLPTIPIAPEEDDDMIRELILTPDGTVWWCVNRVHRYPIPGVKQLQTYQAHLRDLGLPDRIVKKSHEDIKAYGAIAR